MEYEEQEQVYDTKFNEVFAFEKKRDIHAVNSDPKRFRVATEAEIKNNSED